MEQAPEFLTLAAVADVLKVGVPTVQSLVDRGLLASQTQGQQLVIPYHAVLAFLQADQRDLLGADQTPDRDLGIGTEPLT